MELKAALSALLFAPTPGFPLAIANGEKAITIREGHRDYRSGSPVMLCCHIDSWAIMADLTEVRHATIASVTREEYEADGFGSTDDMLATLRCFYPELSMGSPVTIIRWNNVRGFLPDNRDNLIFFE